MTVDWLNRLGKWRTVLTGWQLGTREKGDAPSDAVRDHRETTLVLRTEMTAISALLIRKGVFTVEEFRAQAQEEARLLCEAYERRFPGFRATDYGMVIETEKARETTRGWPA